MTSTLLVFASSFYRGSCEPFTYRVSATSQSLELELDSIALTYGIRVTYSGYKSCSLRLA